MANSMNEMYEKSLLAMASYSDGFLAGDLTSADFNTTQANFITTNYVKLTSLEDSLSGFSGAFYKSLTGPDAGTITFAIRGTDGVFSSIDDLVELTQDFMSYPSMGIYGVAVDQIVSMMNFYFRAITPEDVDVAQYVRLPGLEFNFFTAKGLGIDGLDENTKISVAGHSLGGHLAQAFVRLFPDTILDAYTFNGVGVNSGADGLTILQAALSILTGPIPINPGSGADHLVTNVIAEGGIEFASAIGDSLGDFPLNVFIEEGGALHNHAIKTLSDSLAIYDMFSNLDNSVPHHTVSKILYSASQNGDASLEAVVSGIASLFGLTNFSQIATGDGEALHYAIAAIDGVASTDSYSVNLFSDQVARQYASNTDTGRGVRYAIANLLPFVVSGDLEGTEAAGGAYDLTDSEGNMLHSDDYWIDRGEMLSTMLERDHNDAQHASLEFTGKPTYFEDRQSNTSFITGQLSFPGGGTAYTEFGVTRVLFGDASDDASLLGGSWGDALYGMDGNDTLEGEGGNDHLEGGSGNDRLVGGADNDTLLGGSGVDTYVFGSSDGQDIIIDSDGLGFIEIGGQAINGGSEILADAGIWNSADGNINYILSPDGTLHIDYGDGLIRVTDYSSGDLDVALTDFVDDGSGTGGNALVLTGTDQDEGLVGSDEDEILYGLGGEDQVSGKGGDDVLEGGTGIDRLAGGYGKDILFATQYMPLEDINQQTQATGLKGDWLAGEMDDDLLFGDASDDVLFGGGNSDSLWGGAGNDVIIGDNHLMAVDSSWQITPNGTFDLFISPVLNKDSELNFLAGEEDIAYGGTGDDFIATQLGDDIAFGEAGQDTMVGGSHSDTLYGGAGNDIISGDYHDYAYEPPNGLGVQGNDTLDGGAGNDWIQGEGGDDTVLGGTGSDTLLGDADYLLGTDHGNDHLEGGGGSDTLYGQGSDDVLFGGEGADTLVGDDNEALLNASYHGDDVIYGGAGDDLIAGSGGNDEIYGGADDDYIYGDESVIGLAASFHGHDRVFGEAGNDTLSGNGGSDYLAGGDGNDHLDGDAIGVAAQYHGDDELNGGSGNDILYGRGGSDRLLGGSGDDYLAGGDDGDFLNGGYGSDYLLGEAGDDTLVGSAGYDVLDGGSGSNRYELHYGDAEELIVLSDTAGGAGQGTHDIYLPAGVSASQLRVAQGGSHGTDLVIGYGAGDTITLSGVLGFDVETGYFTASNGNAQDVKLYLSDTSYLSIDEVLAVATRDNLASDYNDMLIGTGAADTLESGYGDDVIYGMDGDDTLSGFYGEDEIYGGNGHDQIRGEYGDDLLYGGGGDDVIEGLSGADIIYGGAGNDSLHAQGLNQSDTTDGDVLYGGAGNDTFNAGSWGYTELIGGEGSDAYYLSVGGDANALINNYDPSYQDSYDVIHIQSLTSRDIAFSREGDDLQVDYPDTPASFFVVQNWFLGTEYQVDEINLARKKYLTAQDINAMFEEPTKGGKGKDKTLAATDTSTNMAEVDSLITAMASFAPEPSSQSYYPQDTRFLDQTMIVSAGAMNRVI
jgi:Ca2+-binding RTX toxin-like protein